MVVYIADHGTVGTVGGVWAGSFGRHPGGCDRRGDPDGGGDDPSRSCQPGLRDQG